MPSAGSIAWPYYLKKFAEVIDKYNFKIILKTDCNNEAYSHPISGGLIKNLKPDASLNIHIVEYDSSVINRTLQLFPDLKIQQGDIRKLHYEDKYFDLVADFSTIDHIPQEDIYRALSEYLRVTKDGGYILLVCWFAYNKTDVIYNFDKWAPADQYFFWEDDILDFLNTNSAKIIETETIVNINYKYSADNWLAIDIEQNPKYYLKFMLVKKLDPAS